MRHAPSRFPTPGREVLGDNPPSFASEDDAREEAAARIAADMSLLGCRSCRSVRYVDEGSIECGEGEPRQVCPHYDATLDEIVEGLL